MKHVSILLYSMLLLLASCEPATEIEYVEVEKEVEKEIIVTETVIEYEDKIETVIEYEDRTVTVTEYVDVEVETEIETIVEVETIIEKEVEVIVEKEVIVTEEILIDNIIETTEIVYRDREVYIMSEEEIPAVEAIKEYDNYVTTDNKVFGVVADGFEEIALISALFKIDGVIYFSIGEKNYSQEKGVITEIEVSDFPGVPESEFMTFENGSYKIQESVYNDTAISKVYNGSPNVGYKQIDGACMRGNDLLYSVSEDLSIRYKGVYIWTVNGNPLRLFESGRIW